MNTSTPVDKSSALWIEWLKFKNSEEYANIWRWPNNIEGNLWCAFESGFRSAASGSPPSPTLRERIAGLKGWQDFGTWILRDEVLAELDRASSGSTGQEKPWTPTAQNVNALPEPVRQYIHDLETNVDPAGTVRELTIARDTIRSLEMLASGSTGGAPTPNKCLMEWRVIVGKSGLPSAFGPTLDQQRILAGQCDFMNTLNSSWDDKPYRVVTLGEVSGAASRVPSESPDTGRKP